MIRIRRSHERGHFDHGWLDTYHTFSFGDYYDPEFTSFGHLRVLNEDRVKPGMGFPTHPHRDMEIVTYVLEGALEHKDSLGTGSVIRPGDVQRMSAGTGITHSEFNASRREPVHFLQIWILPSHRGRGPDYAQLSFPEEKKRAGLCLVASPDGQEGSVAIGQDATIHATILGPGVERAVSLSPGRRLWIQIARGSARLGAETLHAGDGAAVRGETRLSLVGQDESEIILIDLA